MGETTAKPIRHQRRRKHPYRRFVLILTAAVSIIGLGYLTFYLWTTKPGSSATPVPSVSGNDTSVQFK